MSLRARLLLAVAAVAFVALVAADATTYAELRTFLNNQVDSSLESSHGAIEAALEGRSAEPVPPDNDSDNDSDHDADDGGGHDDGNGGSMPPLPPTGSTFCSTIAESDAPGTYVAVLSAAGKVVTKDACAAIQSGGSGYSPALPKKITGFVATGPSQEPTVYLSAGSTNVDGPQFRVRVSILTSGTLKGDRLVLAVPLASTANTLQRLLVVELAVTGGALLAAVLLGWWLVRLGLVPLRRMEHTAEAIAGGDLAHRVPGGARRTEVGRVALALNVMLEHIEGAFAERDETEAQLRESEERLRQFVADASHELRTPVAAVSAYAELFERLGAIPEQDLQRIMGGIRNETTRMGHLVEDLLLLARLDEGRPMSHDTIELVDLIGGAMETAHLVGPEWPVRLEATEAVEVVGDPTRLRQVVDNLLGNVRSHTPPGTIATVRVARQDGSAVIEVSDDGPGITGDQARRIFERFYRVDVSRARTRGGSGLGLAIVASIVEAHGGTVSARSGDPVGAVFTVRLPAAPAPEDDPGGAEHE